MSSIPAGVEEADERGGGVVGDAADPDDGPPRLLAALPVLPQAPLQDGCQHRRRRGLRASKRGSLVRSTSRGGAGSFRSQAAGRRQQSKCAAWR